MISLMNLTGFSLFLAFVSLIICGIFECFAGFRIIKGVLVAAGICVGALSGWNFACAVISQLSTNNSMSLLIQIICAIIMALIISMLAFKFFLAGAFIVYGFASFIFIYSICSLYAIPNAAALIIGIIGGILIGIMLLKTFHGFIIISTSAIGGILIGLGVYTLLKNRFGFYANAVPGLICAISGMIFQFKTTKKESEYTNKTAVKNKKNNTNGK